MGSNIFKNKLGKGTVEKGAMYKRGSLTFDRKMAHELVDGYFEQRTFESAEAFRSHVEEEYSPQLRAYPDLDIEGFIDAIIRRLEKDSDFLHARHVGAVLNPLIALMYELGYKHSSLDLRGVNGMQQNIIADIAATEERPFSLAIYLAECPLGVGAQQVGHSLEHCTVRIAGNADQVGYRGSHSDYIIEDKAVYLGDMASDCAFRFPKVKDAVCTNQRNPVYSGRHSFRMTTEDSYFEISVENNFFIHKNKLLIPDGKGSWKEVLPE